MPVRCHLLKLFVATVGLSVTASGCSSTGLKSGLLSRSESATPQETEEAALAEARETLKDPTQTHLAYAKWQEGAGQATEARASYHLVLEKDPVAVDAILGIARLDMLAGRYDQAEAGYQKAVSLRPHDAHVLDQTAQYYISRERYLEAEQLLLSAIAAKPDEPVYRYHLGVALAKAGKTDKALEHFTRSVGAAEGHYNIAYILNNDGKSAQAEQHLRQALAIKPELSQASEMLAQLSANDKAETQIAARPQPRSEQRPDEQARFEELPDPQQAGSIIPASGDTLEALQSGTRSSLIEQTSGSNTSRGMSLSPGLSTGNSTRHPLGGGYSAPASGSGSHTPPLEQFLPPLDRSSAVPPASPGQFSSPASSQQFEPPVMREMTPEQREQWENQMGR